MFVVGGNLKDINAKGTRLCPSGSFLFLNWQEPHKNTKESSQAKGFHIELDRNWFEENQLDKQLWEGSKLLTSPYLHHTFGKIYHEFKVYDAFSPVSLQALVLELCDAVQEEKLRDGAFEPSWIKTLEDLIYADEDILSLDNLSGIFAYELTGWLPRRVKLTKPLC